MNPEDEAYVKQLISRMKAQGMAGNPKPIENPNQGSVDQTPGGPIINTQQTSIPNQSNVDIQSEAILSNIKTGEPPVPAKGAFGSCPECGMMHPPLRPGESCPNKKVEIPESGIKDEDINKFLAQLKNISVSQIQSKNIKDGTKLFQQLIITVTKFLEEYKE